MAEWKITLHDRVVKRFEINEGQKKVIGRGNDADVIIDNTAISRLHTAIEMRGGLFIISDLDSLNGTFINGNKVVEETAVTTDDVVTFSKFGLAITDGENEEEALSTAMPMDLDEETVFVSGKPPQASGFNGKAKNSLKVISGSANPEAFSLDGRGSIKIGKDASCDVRLNGWFIAGAQCYLINRDKKFFLVPQRSWVGTFINDTKVRHETALRKGDIITIRGIKIRFE